MDIALFDFDGTITDREMFVAFLGHAAEPRRIALGKTVLAPLAIGYKLGLVPGNLIRAAAPPRPLQVAGIQAGRQPFIQAKPAPRVGLIQA